MIYVIKNTLPSLFTAIFEAYVRKDKISAVVTDSAQLSYFEEVLEIKCDIKKSDRVQKALKDILRGDFSEINLVLEAV